MTEGEAPGSSSERSAAAQPPAAQSPPKEYVFPPSFAQQRLWLLDRLLPLRWVYNVAKAYRLRGELEVEVLRGALDDLVQRHESLRTRFGFEDSGPLQVIAAQRRVTLEVEELGALGPLEREAE